MLPDRIQNATHTLPTGPGITGCKQSWRRSGRKSDLLADHGQSLMVLEPEHRSREALQPFLRSLRMRLEESSKNDLAEAFYG